MNVNLMKSLSLFAALAAAGTVAGCGTSNKPGNSAGIVIKAASSIPAPAGVVASAASVKDSGTELEGGEDASGAVFTVTDATIVISQIDIELPEGTTCADVGDVTAPVSCKESEADDDDGPRIRVDGPFVVDLMTGVSTPSLADLMLPPLVYNSIKIEFKDSIDDIEGEDDEAVAIIDPTDPLLGHTMHAAGTFNYNLTDYTFDLFLDFSEEAEFQNVSGATVDPATLNNLVVSFDVSTWFSDVHIGECLESGGDGSVLLDGSNVTIDEDHDCGNIEDSIKDALESSGDLGDDHEDGSEDVADAAVAK